MDIFVMSSQGKCTLVYLWATTYTQDYVFKTEKLM